MKKNEFLKSLVVTLLFFALSFVSKAQNAEKSTLSMLFAGDVMGHDSQINSAYVDSSGTYDYAGCFKYLLSFIKNVDIAVANLEVTLAGPPFKGYPQFSSPDALAVALKDAGFDLMITANNHSLDRGKNGIERTINVLDTLPLIHTGTFKNIAEREVRYPLIVEKNNIRLAVLNYTYGTNGLKVSGGNIVNYIDTAIIRKDLEKSYLANPDFVIATIHWGLEYQRQENLTQRKIAEFMLTHGADAVIGSHPHVVQPIAKLNSADTVSEGFNIIVYSLGNFISNQRKRYTDGGIIFKMTLEKEMGKTQVADYSYLPTWVYKPVINGKTKFTIIPANTYITDSARFVFKAEEKTMIKTFFEDTRQHLREVPMSDYVIE